MTLIITTPTVATAAGIGRDQSPVCHKDAPSCVCVHNGVGQFLHQVSNESFGGGRHLLVHIPPPMPNKPTQSLCSEVTSSKNPRGWQLCAKFSKYRTKTFISALPQRPPKIINTVYSSLICLWPMRDVDSRLSRRPVAFSVISAFK